MIGNIKRMLVSVAALLIVALVSGCAIVSGPSEKEAEWERLAEGARVNKAQRQAARRRAVGIQRVLRVVPIATREVSPGCRRRITSAYDQIQGIRPIACSDFGARWPYKVQWGFLRCERTSYPSIGEPDPVPRIVFTTPTGMEYAANIGAAGIGYERAKPILRKASAQVLRRGRLAIEKVGLGLCRADL